MDMCRDAQNIEKNRRKKYSFLRIFLEKSATLCIIKNGALKQSIFRTKRIEND